MARPTRPSPLRRTSPLHRVGLRAGLGLLAAAVAVPAGAAAADASPLAVARSAPTVSAAASPAAPSGLVGSGGGLYFNRRRIAARRSVAASETVGAGLGASKTLSAATAALPASVDLRTSGYLPAVGDQGQIGSCATWTIAHTIMGYYAAKSGETGAPYSALYLWADQTGGTNPTTGTSAVGDLTSAKAKGVDTESDFYQGWYGYSTPTTAAERTNAAKYRITGYTTLWQGVNQAAGAKQQLLEQALAAGNPVAVDFQVHSSFEDQMNLPSESAVDPESGPVLGGHMVTAVGYDSTGLVLRNQWGTSWGHGGDLKVTWGWVANQLIEGYTVSGVTSPADSGVRTADAPVVVASSTSSGPATGGTTTTLTGSNLGAATAVTVGGRSATFTRTTTSGATQLVVTVPAGASAGAASILVTNSGGTSAPVPAATFTYTGTAASSAPTVSSVNPTSASTAGGTTVTVTGANLAGASRVTVGGTVAAGVSATSATSLTFVAPAHAAGSAPVVVTTPAGASTSPVSLTYAAAVASAAPVVTSLSPAGGPATATTVTTVTGTGLGQATAVTVGGTAVPFARISGTSLQISVPAGTAGSAAVVVTTPTGSSSGSVAFTRLAAGAPRVTSIAVAPAGRASAVTVLGSGLSTVKAATVGGRGVGGTIYSDTQIALNVPALATGTYPVVVTTATGTVVGTLTVR